MIVFSVFILITYWWVKMAQLPACHFCDKDHSDAPCPEKRKLVIDNIRNNMKKRGFYCVFGDCKDWIHPLETDICSTMRKRRNLPQYARDDRAAASSSATAVAVATAELPCLLYF